MGRFPLLPPLPKLSESAVPKVYSFFFFFPPSFVLLALTPVVFFFFPPFQGLFKVFFFFLPPSYYSFPLTVTNLGHFYAGRDGTSGQLPFPLFVFFFFFFFGSFFPKQGHYSCFSPFFFPPCPLTLFNTAPQPVCLFLPPQVIFRD